MAAAVPEFQSYRNFIEASYAPACHQPVEAAVQSDLISHLCDISIRWEKDPLVAAKGGDHRRRDGRAL
jgi:hypothetical protein